jgi:hypothetical protein
MRRLLKFLGTPSSDRHTTPAAEAARARRSAAAVPPRPLSLLSPLTPARPQTPTGEADWSKVRSPQRAHDQALTELAAQWAAGLPPLVRPVNLLHQYARVANRIALCWTDPVLMAALFDDLLMDKRGGRKGFPPPVALELKRLQQHHHNIHGAGSGDGHDPWASNALAISDR